MSSGVELSIIMVSYNTKEYTLRAIRSIYAETKNVSFEIVLVDNESSDGSLEAVQKEFPEVKSYASGANLGFAGGVHYGVERSIGNKILLINPDTILIDNGVDKLYDFSVENPENGIWGGVTYNEDLSVDTQHAWARHDFLTLLFSALGLSKAFNKSCFFNKDNYGCWDRKTVKEVDILSGCFFLTTRKIWDQLGGLDTTFFMYAEEADYCLRSKKLGCQPIVTPNAKLVHHGGVSYTKFSNKLTALLRGKAELMLRHDGAFMSKVNINMLLLYVLNKVILTKVLKNGSEEHSEWVKVYESRNVWMKGYR